MLCEKCGSEIENITCRQCGNVIMKLGDFCYLCGGRCVEPRGDLSEGTEAGDFNAPATEIPAFKMGRKQ